MYLAENRIGNQGNITCVKSKWRIALKLPEISHFLIEA